MYRHLELIFALEEEIGNSELFTGRTIEFDYLLRWVSGVKKKLNLSPALMARRKKGKSALVQRFYNILFTMNDPMVIPFYYKVKETEISQLMLADEFYMALIHQYAAFITRNPALIKAQLNYDKLLEYFKHDSVLTDDILNMQEILASGNFSKAWDYAAYAGERISILKNVRIIQILDEFQYFDQYVYTSFGGHDRPIALCGTYHHVGASKISPVIVTGSYITCLQRIVMRMTGRYSQYLLKNLPPEEALEAVYKHSEIFGVPITSESARYIASATEGDVFYINSIFKSKYPANDLTSIDCINEIIHYETRTTAGETGEISAMWLEYLYSAIEKVNDKNGKRIILYLAKYDKEERTRKEIMDDLQLDMTDKELEKKLDSFIQADILTYGTTRFDYRGLGDKFFESVFRGMYQKEIDAVGAEDIRKDIDQRLKSAFAKLSYFKGLVGELQVVNRFLAAVMNKTPLKEILYYHIDGYELSSLSYSAKKRFYHDQVKFTEVDIYLQSASSSGTDFVVEVKNWQISPNIEQINKFINTRNLLLEKHLPAHTGFIFCSAKPISPELEELLKSENIMIMYLE